MTVAKILASPEREEKNITRKDLKCFTNTKFLKGTDSRTKTICMHSTQKVGFSSKSSTVVGMSTFTVSVGEKVEVGEFFWIPKSDMIGHDRDAKHGHNSRHAGSVDVGCVLTVRAVENDYAIVRLDRPSIPYGAPAAIGAVFQIQVSQMASWPEKLEAIREHEEQRRRLARSYCK